MNLDGLPMGELSDQTVREFLNDPHNDCPEPDVGCKMCGVHCWDNYPSCFKQVSIGKHGTREIINFDDDYPSEATGYWYDCNEFGICDEEYPEHWWKDWGTEYCAEWTLYMNVLWSTFKSKFSILKYFDEKKQILTMLKIIEDESICDDIRIKLWYLLPLGATPKTTKLTESESDWAMNLK